MNVGDEMTWLHVPRGGWWFVQYVPCVVEQVGEKRVRIRVQKLSGEWVSRSVKPENLRPPGYRGSGYNDSSR